MIEFKTSKGEFVVGGCYNGVSISRVGVGYKDDNHVIRVLLGYKLICKLSEATEEDAKEIVDGHQYGYFINYGYSNPALKWVRTAIESLHSLLTSKGIDINNGIWYLFKRV